MQMNKSKFNWGTGIFITIIIFMLITVGSVIFLMNQKVDLVSGDYYNKGIHHQEQIDRMNRANKMGDEVSITLDNGFIRLILPKTFAQKDVNGTIQFYRPSDSNKDFSFLLNIDSTAQQLIPTQNMEKGYWKIGLNWSQDSVEYYKESSFIIN